LGREGCLTINPGEVGKPPPLIFPRGEFMKILCWSCGEPRDTLDEFCPQCGAREQTVIKEKSFPGWKGPNGEDPDYTLMEKYVNEELTAGNPHTDLADGVGISNKPKVIKGKKAK
jgi:hypothetical protein